MAGHLLLGLECAAHKLTVMEAEGSSQARAWLFKERAGRQGTGATSLGKSLPEGAGELNRKKTEEAFQPLALFSPYFPGLIQGLGLTISQGLTASKFTSLAAPPGPWTLDSDFPSVHQMLDSLPYTPPPKPVLPTVIPLGYPLSCTLTLFSSPHTCQRYFQKPILSHHLVSTTTQYPSSHPG